MFFGSVVLFCFDCCLPKLYLAWVSIDSYTNRCVWRVGCVCCFVGCLQEMVILLFLWDYFFQCLRDLAFFYGMKCSWLLHRTTLPCQRSVDQAICGLGCKGPKSILPMFESPHAASVALIVHKEWALTYQSKWVVSFLQSFPIVYQAISYLSTNTITISLQVSMKPASGGETLVCLCCKQFTLVTWCN